MLGNDPMTKTTCEMKTLNNEKTSNKKNNQGVAFYRSLSAYPSIVYLNFLKYTNVIAHLSNFMKIKFQMFKT